MPSLSRTDRAALIIGGLLLVIGGGCRPTSSAPAESAPAESAAAAESLPSTTPTATAAKSTPAPATAVAQPTAASSAHDTTTAAAASPSSPSAPRFTRLRPEATKVDFISRLVPDHPRNYLYHSAYVSGGVAIGDVDGDGRPDLFLADGPGSNRLYRQTAAFAWEEITSAAHVDGGDAWATGATFVDIDNDGDLDLYVCNYDQANALYINDGHGVFRDEAPRYGLDLVDASLLASFADYDRDGHLDLYLLTNRYYQEHGRPTAPPWTQQPDGSVRILPQYERYYALQKQSGGQYTIEEYGRPDYLFHNTGDGKFVDVTKSAGIQGFGFGLSVTWWDYDHDGWLDLYVANDFNDPDALYHNERNGTFRNTLAESLPHTPWFSMGSDFGDLNNDGLFDLICVDMSPRTHFKQKTTMGSMSRDKLKAVAGPPPQLMRNAVYLNSGTARFWEVAYQVGLADSDWSWAVKLNDFDNDGWQDVFISNGIVRSFNDSDFPFDQRMLIGHTYWDLYRNEPERPEQNLAFRNNHALRFDDVSQPWGLAQVGISYAAATGDLDRDGDLDLVVVNLNEPLGIYRNETNDEARGLTLELRGTTSNRFGVGAQVTMETSEGRQTRLLSPTTGFLSSNDPAIHFGLGSDARGQQIHIQWPSGIEQTIDVPPDARHWLAEEPAHAAATPRHSPSPAPSTLFAAASAMPSMRHTEREFDDFQVQPLLPNQLSQLGPGMAVGDADGDDDEDLFLGGAAGSSGTIWLQENGRFVPAASGALEADAAAEDMGALWLDVDLDDDLDLWVVSGGVEARRAEELNDRLYLNDGKGKLERADRAQLPPDEQSGGPIAAADFDRDGDLDVFVGGRVVPGAYPLAAENRLWINDNGRFADQLAEVAPTLRLTGLVTAAVWSDVDADGWIDLLVAHEWGPVRLFHNEHGQLTDRTEAAGLSAWSGWWNSISPVDVDNDLDLDYVVGNFGRNTKYHASAQKPAVLYYGDFDQTGKKQLVEAEYEDGQLVPIRGRSCSSKAMPFLRDKFKTYRDFALADLSTLYTDECLAKADRFEINTLDSGVLVQQPDGTFTFQPLPQLVQSSPVFGTCVTDANGDGHWDLFVAQNFFEPQAETGRMDGGLSLLLAGSATGTFTPFTPPVSGVILPGDMRGSIQLDWNGDRRPDLLVAENNGPVQILPRSASEPEQLELRLRGARGNRSGVGSRVRIERTDGPTSLVEINSTHGYLTQGSSRLWVAHGPDHAIRSVTVTWPDGTSTSRAIAPTERSVVISRE